MKLDRNLGIGRGKYALIKLRNDPVILGTTSDNQGLVISANAIDYGDTPDTDFFVIRLKDKYAAPALHAYAEAAQADDPEYAAQVRGLAITSQNHPHKTIPT